MTIDTRHDEPFYSLSDCIEQDLIQAASNCIAAQRDTVRDRHQTARSAGTAEAAVSAEALEKILASGEDIHGISANDGISNAVVINAGHLKNSVRNDVVGELRERVDREMTAALRRVLVRRDKMLVHRSGHFWYPPGSYMGWHTNNRAPGWRAYLTHATGPGRSFFQYRDPRNGEIVTSMDATWDLRIFRADPTIPFWHAVYSDTDRYSFGYAVIEKSAFQELIGRAKSYIRQRYRRTVDSSPANKLKGR